MSVEIIDKIKPKNNGDFSLMDAADVEMPDGTRLTDHEFLESSQLPEAINEALRIAKESGKFDGKDGIDGKDGKDGYTPQKGVDYFDGQNGKNGVDGKDGYTPVKGVDYFDGKNGSDGKDGADGKTPVKGVDYFDGKDGADGKTPVKGEDYYTEADKTEMVNAVISALPTWTGGSY